MTDDRRCRVPGGTYFFTLGLQDRSAALLADRIADLRTAFREVRAKHPIKVEAIVVLPAHPHRICSLPGETTISVCVGARPSRPSRAQFRPPPGLQPHPLNRGRRLSLRPGLKLRPGPQHHSHWPRSHKYHHAAPLRHRHHQAEVLRCRRRDHPASGAQRPLGVRLPAHLKHIVFTPIVPSNAGGLERIRRVGAANRYCLPIRLATIGICALTNESVRC
jgi:REP element-mobilizing transposase RayT